MGIRTYNRHKPTISMTKPNSHHMGDKMSNMLDDPRMKTVTSESHGQFKMKDNSPNPMRTQTATDDSFGGSPGGGAKGARTFGDMKMKTRGVFK